MNSSLQKYSKEELIQLVNSLKKRKKFGLVWEEKPEQIVQDLEKKIPMVESVKSKDILSLSLSNQTNYIIEGDNYHSLSVLNYTHAGKIDVIYIDPPYNRGGDFRYNDKYVDKDDTYRHSKWLSFMEKRLTLAKKLLTDQGVCYISIDDTEYAHLILLCHDIFGEENVDTLIWKKSGVGRDGKMKNTSTFRKDHEYVIVCFLSEQKLNKLKELPNFTTQNNNSDNDPRGPWMSGSISRSYTASNPKHHNYYTVVSPAGNKITRQFEVPESEFNRLNAEGRISWGKSGGGIPRIKIFLDEERSVTPYSVLEKGTTTEGTKEATEIIGRDCVEMRPKPSALIRTLLQIALPEGRDGIVLDFFAGTGTTGQAILQLNQEYGTKHTFIICTDNQTGILDEFTYPRIWNVINGYGSVSGIPADVRYFKTTFIEKRKTSDQTRIDLVSKSMDMICLREGAFNFVVDEKSIKILENEYRYVCIVFDVEQIESLITELSNLPINKEIHIYVFTLSNDAYLSDFSNLNRKYSLIPIPESILEVYRRIHAENFSGNLKR